MGVKAKKAEIFVEKNTKIHCNLMPFIKADNRFLCHTGNLGTACCK
jgi:hypothetical protein